MLFRCTTSVPYITSVDPVEYNIVADLKTEKQDVHLFTVGAHLMVHHTWPPTQSTETQTKDVTGTQTQTQTKDTRAHKHKQKTYGHTNTNKRHMGEQTQTKTKETREHKHKHTGAQSSKKQERLGTWLEPQCGVDWMCSGA